MKTRWKLISLVCAGLITSGTASAQIPGTFIGANKTNTALADPDAPEPNGTPREDENFCGDADANEGTANLSRWFDGTNTTGSSTRHLLDGGIEIPDSGGFRGLSSFFNPAPPSFFGGQVADPGLVTTLTGLNDGDQYDVFLIYTQSPIFTAQNIAAGLVEGETEQVDFEDATNLTELADISSAFTGGGTVVFSLPLGTATVANGEIQVFVDNLRSNSTNPRVLFDPSTAYNGISISAVTPPTLIGDVDLSGTVDFLDISPFIALLTSSGFQLEADINEDGSVDFLDIAPFITILSS